MNEESLDTKKIEATIEALLFACGDAVPIEKIAEVLKLDKKITKALVSNMMYSYNNSIRGIIIREINEKYQLCTKPELYDLLKVAFEVKARQELTQAAYEILAVIAYNSPITKAKIEQIRGVSCENSINKLMSKNLIKEAGRLDGPGRPIIYQTTEEFLRAFGFSSKLDLPVLELNEIEVIKMQTEKALDNNKNLDNLNN